MGLPGPWMCALLAVFPPEPSEGPRSHGILCSARKESRGGQQRGAEETMPETLAACPELAGRAGARWPCASVAVSKASQPRPGLRACTAEGSPQPWPEGGLPLSVLVVGGDGGLIHLSPLPRGHVPWSVWQHEAEGETTAVCSPHSALAQVRHGERPAYANHAAGFLLVKFI